MRNLNRFVRRSGGALGDATGQAPPQPLSEEDIRKVGEVVRDPTFHVYVGEEDDIIRRVVRQDRVRGARGGAARASAASSRARSSSRSSSPT